MTDIVEVFIKIKQSHSRDEKKMIIANNAEVDGLIYVLKFLYDPYIKTGISKKKLSKIDNIKGVPSIKIPFKHDALYKMLNYLENNNTGSDTDLEYAAYFLNSIKVKYGEDSIEESFARGLITKDIKVGMTAKTLNSIFGDDFIPIVGCMLGKLYSDVPEDSIKWPCIVTEKLDGIRRIIIKKDGVCTCYSRSGHKDEGLVEILEDAKELPDNHMYDGELLAIGEYDNCIAQRQATNSIANRKGVKKGLVFNVFDMVALDEYNAGVSKVKAFERKVRLGATLMDESVKILIGDEWYGTMIAFGIDSILKYIKPVPILGLVKRLSDVTPIVEKIWSAGGEGVMLNTANGLYEVKRSSSLLKIKHTEEHTLTVIDLLEGNGKNTGKLGAVVVDYNGVKLGVGSGFTDMQRIIIWDNGREFIGREAEIETFGESINMDGRRSLNCPIFKRFVGDE